MTDHNQILNDAEFVAAGRTANAARTAALDAAWATYWEATKDAREARDAAIEAAQVAYWEAEEDAYAEARSRLAKN